MNDGRDAEDAWLLDSGEHARLLAKYEPVIMPPAWPRCAGILDAEDVPGRQAPPLARALARGKRYPVPSGSSSSSGLAEQPTQLIAADPSDTENAGQRAVLELTVVHRRRQGPALL